MLLICLHMKSSWSNKGSSVKPKGLGSFAGLLIFNTLFIVIKQHNILLILFMFCVIKKTVPQLCSWSTLSCSWSWSEVWNWSKLSILDQFSIQENTPSSYGSHFRKFFKVYQNTVKYNPFVLHAKTWKYCLSLWRGWFDNGHCSLGN